MMAPHPPDSAMASELPIERRLLRRISRLNRAFDLIEPDDRVLVACSGGKDSWALLHLLRAYRDVVPFEFSLVAVNLDQGHPGFPAHVLREHFEAEGFDYRMVAQDTYSVVREKVTPGKTTCSLCSRLRRGVLYRVASDLGAHKIALGHHADDAIETLLLNLLFAGSIKSMPPRLRSDDGRHTVIRPLAWCFEADVAAYARARAFPIVPCDLCGSQPDAKRQQVKALVASLEAAHPGIRRSLLASLGNPIPSHLFLRSDGSGEAPAQGPSEPPGPDVLLRHLRGP